MAKKAAKKSLIKSGKELTLYYRDMLLIRRFEEKAGQLYGMGLIGGFCHLYIGQEAVVVGMLAAAKKELDTIDNVIILIQNQIKKLTILIHYEETKQ